MRRRRLHPLEVVALVFVVAWLIGVVVLILTTRFA